MLQHWSAILRESTWTKEYTSNLLIQVLIALTVVTETIHEK